MNAVEIEEALSELAAKPFDRGEFAFGFLAAFDNKETTLKRLRKGDTNASDIPGAVLQRNNIHIATCEQGTVAEMLAALRSSPATGKAKARYILATDGESLEAEDTATGETVAGPYSQFPDHFGFFLPLARISTVKEIKDNPIDVRATGRLSKLYVALQRENPAWAKDARRADMNHFMARLVFCFFAEDTDIFEGKGLFTRTVAQMSEHDGSNTHEVMETIFRAMNTKVSDRAALPRWALAFPYVNGDLFSGSTEVPRFTRTARSYLMHAGNLNWKEINPDIFGSMIQAVADDEERGSLGMHYTSVPNILKVLNPLFLDDLRAQLDAAGDNKTKLLNLRKRMARIRVFDPACGSGNFLVIAYKHMRAIESEINRLRGEPHLRSEIPLTNFRGIEIRSFPAEIARLALIIAEFQCDVLYRGQKDALAEFLPLDAQNWIVCGNALRLDWLGVCPPTGHGVKVAGDDLFSTSSEQAEIDFRNEGGETYICGNPPYLGSTGQSPEQKADLEALFEARVKNWKSLDYVAGWFIKAADYGQRTRASTAFVSTNSVCQGEAVPILWPLIFDTEHQILFAHTSFKWANLASHNAGVTVAIVGISRTPGKERRLFSTADDGTAVEKVATFINAYLVPGANVIVTPEARTPGDRGAMLKGNMPTDGGNLILSGEDKRRIVSEAPEANQFILAYCGSNELINGESRYCLWIDDERADQAGRIAPIRRRLDGVRAFRSTAKAPTTRPYAKWPHKFRQIQGVAKQYSIVVPSHSSEDRVLHFYQANGRAPQAGAQREIFERMYAVRLDRLRRSAEARALLALMDTPGLLSGTPGAETVAEPVTDDELLDQLGVGAMQETGSGDITNLRHVRSYAARQAMEEIADRKACEDFQTFAPLFERAERELKSGVRRAPRFGRDATVATGNFFILGGQLAYVAAMDEQYRTPNNEANARLRVIFSNGTESDLLLRSLQRALYKDDTGRRVTGPAEGPLFGDEAGPDDIESGTIYVLRSLSNHPFVAANRQVLHKIGVTGSDVDARIANAEKDATYLLAKVEVVASYKLHNLSRVRLENIFHKLFGAAQVDLTIEDRFGNPVKPREWFLVPLQVIDEAVQRIRDGSITNVTYDPKTASLVAK